MDPKDEEAHYRALARFGGKMPQGGKSTGITSRKPPHFVEHLLKGKSRRKHKGVQE